MATHERKCQEFALTWGYRISTHRRRVLSVFQAPSALYRLLGIRHRRSPCFLHRNLKYLRGRISKRDLASRCSRGQVVKEAILDRFCSSDEVQVQGIFEFLQDSGKVPISSWTIYLIQECGTSKRIVIRSSISVSQNRFCTPVEVGIATSNIKFQLSANLKNGSVIESQRIPLNYLKGPGVAIQLYSKMNEGMGPATVINCRFHSPKRSRRSSVHNAHFSENFPKPLEKSYQNIATSVSAFSIEDEIYLRYCMTLRNESLTWQPTIHQVTRCPWCSFAASSNIYGYLMHLQNVHPRFVATFQKNSRERKVTISVAEERADRSIASDSSPEDDSADFLWKQFGCNRHHTKNDYFYQDHGVHKFISSNRRPARRQYYTNYGARVMLQDHKDSGSYESTACMQWRHRESIADFIDISPQEKELMKLWNSYLISNPIYADIHVMHLCQAFVVDHVESLIKLRNNLLLHFFTMFNFGVLTTANIEQLTYLVNEKLGQQNWLS